MHVYIGDFATTGYEGELKYPDGNEVMPTPPIIPGSPDAPSIATDHEQTSLSSDKAGTKMTIRNGQLLLQWGDELYDITGMKVQ